MFPSLTSASRLSSTSSQLLSSVAVVRSGSWRGSCSASRSGRAGFCSWWEARHRPGSRLCLEFSVSRSSSSLCRWRLQLLNRRPRPRLTQCQVHQRGSTEWSALQGRHPTRRRHLRRPPSPLPRPHRPRRPRQPQPPRPPQLQPQPALQAQLRLRRPRQPLATVLRPRPVQPRSPGSGQVLAWAAAATALVIDFANTPIDRSNSARAL